MPLGYAVIADEEPLLQSLRTDLSPQLPEVYGFAGTELLKYLSTELNYQNSRVILECAAGTAETSCFQRRRTTTLAQQVTCP